MTTYLFDLLNNTVFGRNISTTHKCHENNCNGSKLHGLRLKCSSCGEYCYFECIASRPELKTLLGLMNFQDKGNASRSVQTKLTNVFGEGTLFKFKCPPCNEHDNSHTIDLDDNNAENEDQSKQIDELKSRVSSLELVFNDVGKMLKSQIKNNSTMSALMKKCVTVLGKNDEMLQTAKGQLLSTGSLQSHEIEVDAQVHQDPNEITDVSSEPIDSTNNGNGRQSHIASEMNGHDISAGTATASTKPKPVSTTNTTNAHKSKNTHQTETLDGAKIHEIFISKFPTRMSCDDMAKLIVEKTSLQDDSQFNLEKIKFNSFAGFKVTVLKAEIREEILDSKIWSPKYNACMFDHNKKQKADTQREKTKPVSSNNNINNINNNNKNSNKGNNNNKDKVQNYGNRQRVQTNRRTITHKPQPNSNNSIDTQLIASIVSACMNQQQCSQMNHSGQNFRSDRNRRVRPPNYRTPQWSAPQMFQNEQAHQMRQHAPPPHYRTMNFGY